MITKTNVINICGGPGVGKSTVASGLFHKLKANKVSCELITEYAKEVTWEQTHALLENQIHIFSEQFRRQWRLIDKVDYIITDSPLILNSVYYDYYLDKLGPYVKFSPEYIELSRKFFDETYKEFNNVNFYINRPFTEIYGAIVYDYESSGRNQTVEEALKIDKKIQDKLWSFDPGYTSCHGDTRKIVDNIFSLTMSTANSRH